MPVAKRLAAAEHAQHRIVAGGGRYGRCRTQQPPGSHAGPARAHHLRKHGDMPGCQRKAKQGFRQCVRRPRRAADQGFIAEQLGIAGLHDRLEHRMQRRDLRAWHRRPGRYVWCEVER